RRRQPGGDARDARPDPRGARAGAARKGVSRPAPGLGSKTRTCSTNSVTSAVRAHAIQGERVELPVRIRDAAVASAMFAVPADAARAVIAYSGPDVAEPLPGRAICSLAFVRYADGDLGPYHEFAVAFLVRPPGSPPPAGALGGLRAMAGAGAFIHWLPVNQEFTLEAGRTIWGFPKEMADIP